MTFPLRFAGACASLAALLVALPASADGDDTPLTNLVALASQRIALAEPVAQWKWANHKPIEDKPREAQLLADVERRAVASGIDRDYAHAFFADQIEASKIMQNALFESWRAGQPPQGTPPDLATTTRPQFDKLTQSLIAALARVAPLRDAPDCQSRVAGSIANWKSLTRYDSRQTPALNAALSHVCTGGGASSMG
ncbi:chorismate mutase [Burkholderia sp. Ac-20379]|uniref:chorismate mutase n=1 Tax=Burkholderia sp. Ac-20379 TaxID=2703900 RepID=UPI0019812D05|nr:chorismate mutase [Burkholderia sp. Ac-20379]MBN3723753.1 chorismate mutase [Burkholderia sp. Ac-20379]